MPSTGKSQRLAAGSGTTPRAIASERSGASKRAKPVQLAAGSLAAPSKRARRPVAMSPRAVAPRPPGLVGPTAQLAAGSGPAPRLISPGPPAEWRFGELTVVIGARAELRYARETVGSSLPTPAAIVEAVERARSRLAARSRSPDVMLPALAAAYTAVLARHKGRSGDRVALVELRDELEGTRAQFAWDIARLRRERRLVVGGRRIDLGVAAGQMASRASRVVWIENDGGGGSYFQSFRLIAQEVRP